MMLLTTDETRVVSAVLEFGAATVGLMSDGDVGHLDRARSRLAHHNYALIESMWGARGYAPKEPA